MSKSKRVSNKDLLEKLKKLEKELEEVKQKLVDVEKATIRVIKEEPVISDWTVRLYPGSITYRVGEGFNTCDFNTLWGKETSLTG